MHPEWSAAADLCEANIVVINLLTAGNARGIRMNMDDRGVVLVKNLFEAY